MRKLIGILTAALVVSTACAVTSKRDRDNDDDDDDDGVGANTNTGGNAMGGGGGTGGGGAAGQGCEGVCAKVVAANCPDDTQAACMTECNALVTNTPASCTTELDALLACQNTSQVACVDGSAKVSGCDTQGTAYLTCVQGGGGGECYDGHGDCNPMKNTCTTAGTACKLAQDELFHCFDPPNSLAVGAACDNANDQNCVHGAVCVGAPPNATCIALCCEQTDCTAGSCQELLNLGSWSVKGCAPG